MIARTFVCQQELCTHYRQTVTLDENFRCWKYKDCEGKIVPTLSPLWKPFWRDERFLLGMTLLLASAFVTALLLHTFGHQLDSSGSVKPSLVTPTVLPPRDSSGSVKPSLVTPTVLPPRDPRLEVEKLVASSQTLLSLWLAKLVALDTAESKSINGQRVSTPGRQPGETLDRIKKTYRQEHDFSSFAQQTEDKIRAETSRYQDLLQSMATLPPREVTAVFDEAHRVNSNLSGREVLAIGLVQLHVNQYNQTGRLSFDQIYSDYEAAARR